MFIYQFVPSDTLVLIPSHLGKYKCLLLIERPVGEEFRHELSRLLVSSGCLFTMAWGLDCSLWDDSVDYANIEKFDYRGIPDDQVVMTTWHEEDTLEEVLRFAKVDAVVSYADEPLHNLLVLDFVKENRAELIEAAYNRII
ncbi:DUF7684 family protein [Ruegeria lacuscaerulensis]